MESKLIAFYRTLCDIMGVEIDDDGRLFIMDGNIKHPFLIDGKQSYLPTEDNIKTMSEYDTTTGKVRIVKSLFNPLSENVSRGVNKSFNKVKRTLEMRLLGAIYYIGNYLLTEVSDAEKDIADIDVIKFAVLIGKTKTTSKKIVNDKTLSNWKKLYDAISTKHINKKYVNFRIIKGGTINGIDYNRTGTLEFPLAETLDEVGKDKVVLDVKLQRNDITSFLAIFEYITGDKVSVLDGVSIGSLNKLSPSMHVLLALYDKITQNLVDVSKSVMESTDNESIKRMVEVKKLPYDVSSISDIIDELSSELRNIPTEEGAIITSKLESKQVSGFNKNIATDEPKKSVWGGKVEAVDKTPIQPATYNTPQQPTQSQGWGQRQQPVQQQGYVQPPQPSRVPPPPSMQQRVVQQQGYVQPQQPSRVPPPPSMHQRVVQQPVKQGYVQPQLVKTRGPQQSGWGNNNNSTSVPW